MFSPVCLKYLEVAEWQRYSIIRNNHEHFLRIMQWKEKKLPVEKEGEQYEYHDALHNLLSMVRVANDFGQC